LELFFKNQGSNCEIMDCGLILEKPRGFFAKLSGIIDFGLIFVRKKDVDSVHWAMDGATELAEGWAVARRLGDGGEGGGGESSSAGSLGARNWGKEERGRSGGRRGCWGALL
jgi:hypothetical protein